MMLLKSARHTAWCAGSAALLLGICGAVAGWAQPPVSGETAEQDHRRMLEQLHITALRRGADGNPTSPNAANADETKVGVFTLPNPLVLKNGQPVTTPKQWWGQRRAEIVEDFDREVYGRVPASTPKVTWEVVSTTREKNGDVPVVTKKLVGRVDNSAYPGVTVEMQATMTTPASATVPVPVVLEFGFVFPAGFRPPGPPPAQNGPTWQQQVLAKGWGYAVFVPTTVQADNGAGLSQGIIGLMNRGQPRKPDDWGALRAWAWGASRVLDYFETDKSVNAKQVAIEGLSRYGKAAAVTMAYDSRFALAFIGSSGEGGVKIHRRNFGEKVENVASSGEYHWMAGNFLKYAGPLTPNDLPVDAHELVALCAPRPVFVGCGSPSVEGNWVDDKGMFLGAAHAGPVYRLLGKKDLGTTEMPPLGTPLVDGEIAFRQHSGGHTNGPNWPTFLTWASRYVSAPPAAALTPTLTVTTDKPGGVYAVGETVHWTVEAQNGTPPSGAHYTLKSGGLTDVGHGDLVFHNNRATLDTPLAAPNTLLLEVTWQADKPGRASAGAVAAPDQITPAAPAPKDFQLFWDAQIKALKKIAPNPKLEPGDAGRPNVSYAKVTLDNINDTHVQGQIARPAAGDKFPAILILQWAGVYGLQKGWVTDRAADGWLALDIEAHDIPVDAPEAFYQAQNNGPLKNYWTLGNDDREKSYFLRMYLSAYQALEYLKTRPDWDGKTLVVMGTSQGGQQSLMLAGLHPENITAMMVLVPSGCDMLAPTVGRATGFPSWYYNTQGKNAEKVRETSRYFDPVNFASRIRCPVLVGLGLRDDVSPPSGVLAAVHEIRTPKEVLILARSGHQNENGSQKPFDNRAYGAWLPALKQGKPAPIEKAK